ncbi:MAG: TonB-dependent receptor [Flavobacteriaceae bacterium]|nr:TonB-dependent receptor [Flavobacteriaceae bacterium]
MKLILSILFIIWSAIVVAQNIINGTVTNANSEPILGVDVYIPKLHKGTTTDLKGNYTLKNLPNGTIKIIFSSLGFKTTVRTIDLDREEMELNMVMEESVFEMDEVIIATPFNKLQSENVMKVEHRTIENLKRQGSISLIDGISTIAGVSQVSTGMSIGKPVIRGLSGNRVLVYTQGVRLENQQFGDEHGLGLNAAGMESVEIIKGPASLLYGSDALGGVLYFNPEKYANSNEVVSNISNKYFSNTLGSSSLFNFKASTDQLKFLTSMAYDSHSDYKIPDGNRVTNSRFNEFDLKSGIGYDSKFFSTDIRFNFNTTKIGVSEEIGEQSTSISLELPFQRIDNYIVSAHNHIYFKNSKLDVDVGYVSNNRKEFEESKLDADLSMKLKTLTYDLKYHLPKLNKIESIVGIQGLTQRNDNFGEEILIPNAKINDLGGFITASYDWKDNSIQGGFRFDTRNIETEEHIILHEDEIHTINALNKSFQSMTASLGYKTKLFNEIDARFNFATGYRAPNLAELTSNGIHHGTNRYEIGTEDLENEQNYQFDVSLEYYNEHIEFFTNVFYNDIKDYIFLSPTNEIIDETNVFIYTQDNANLYGGEFGFHLHPHPFDWLHLESSFEIVIGSQENGDYLPLIPAKELNNTLRTDFTINQWFQKGYASVKLESVFDQNNISDFESVSPGYNLLHFSLGGEIKIQNTSFELNFNINNLLDTSYISHLSRLKSEGIQNIGRNMIIGLKFDI